MAKANNATVGTYLAKRLEQAGIRHIFGVPGDYVLDFFDILEESNLNVVCNCNELNAGYAADAYARLNGVSGVCVTYGVGGLSLLNAVAGAFAERLPLIVISGGPNISERSHHHLLHHTIGDMNLQYNIYEKITVASVILTNPRQAPRQIDETIEACLRFKRPVYIEIPTDIVSMPCQEPGPFVADTDIPSDKEAIDEAVSEAVELLEAAKDPVILVGIEAHRFRIQNELQDLVDHSGYPFASTLLGKTVIPEEHPQFIGVYGGYSSWEDAHKVIEKSDMILCLGTLMTDIEVGGVNALFEPGRMIVANSDKVRIKNHVYNQICLISFIRALKDRLKKGKPSKVDASHPSIALKERYTPVPEQKITIKRFYHRINNFIDSGTVLIADAGDSTFNVANLFCRKGVQCIIQAFYLSIGYSIPATLGAKLAEPGLRPITIVGDGAFQMTAQEVSTLVRENLNPIIFLMNNDGYTIERVMQDGAFNDLHMWKYSELPSIFNGGWGCAVKTEGELEEALQKALERNNELALIEIQIDRWDCSDSLRELGAIYKQK